MGGSAIIVDVATGVILVGFFVGTLWRPSVAYVAAITLFALEQWAQGSGYFFAVNSQLINYSVGATVLMGVLMSFGQGRNPLGAVDRTYLTIGLLFLYSLLSYFWSVYPSGTLSVYWYAGPYLLVNVFLLPLVFNSERDFRIALIGLFVVSLFLIPALIFGTRIHAWGRTIESATVIIDRYGEEKTRLSALAVADYGAIIALICLTARIGKISNLMKYASWAMLPLCVYLVMRSESRGQFLAVILVGMLTVRLSFPGKKIGGSVQAFLLAAVFLVVGIFAFRFFMSSGEDTRAWRWSLSYWKEDYGSTRVAMCGMLMNAWLNSSPINLLVGLGSSASFDPKIVGGYPHVQVVEVLGELGLVGLAVYGAIFAFGTRASMKALRLTKTDAARRGMVVPFIGFALLYFILSFKQGSFLTNYGLYANLAILGRYALIAQKRQKDELQRSQQFAWQANAQQAKSAETTQVAAARR